MSHVGRTRLIDAADAIYQGAPLVTIGVLPKSRVPVLHPRDLLPPGPPSLTDLECAGVASGARRERAVVKAGDVLVTARGTQLRAAVVPVATGGAIASANLLLVRLRDDLLPEVLVAYMGSSTARARLLAHGKGSTGFVITPRMLGGLEIPVPPLAIQQQIANFVRSARDSIRATERVLELRKELVQAAIDRVFEGGELSVDTGGLR